MANHLTPSYYGYVGSTKDALLIIQSILNKQLNLIPRRPHERERLELIKSGNVFIFIEQHSGIKRWTDGISWSPSRILGRFLVYRELDKDVDNNDHSPNHQNNHSPNDSNDNNGDKKRKKKRSYDEFEINNTQHGFKDQGLIKKTLSITTNLSQLDFKTNSEKQTIHLISYYNANDVLNGKLLRPSESDLKNIPIDKALWDSIKESNLGGKIPIEDEAFYFLDNNYQLQNMSMMSHQPSVSHRSSISHPSMSQVQIPVIPQMHQVPPSQPPSQQSSQPISQQISPQLPMNYQLSMNHGANSTVNGTINGNGFPTIKGTPQAIPPPMFYNKNYMLPIPSNYDYYKKDDDDQFTNPINSFNISNNLNSLYHEQNNQNGNLNQSFNNQNLTSQNLTNQNFNYQGNNIHYMPYYSISPHNDFNYSNKKFKDDLHLDDNQHFITNYNQ